MKNGGLNPMKKTALKRATLPPGIIPFKGPSAKLKRWLRECGEPEDLAHAGVGTRMRQAALKK
jgi:hypothetical protein